MADDRLDVHCRRFIGLSPLLVLSSADGDGRLDASPRGGEPESEAAMRARYQTDL